MRRSSLVADGAQIHPIIKDVERLGPLGKRFEIIQIEDVG
jgi:hypothetical protein